nr:glycerol kinase 3 [Quercus suber]
MITCPLPSCPTSAHLWALCRAHSLRRTRPWVPKRPYTASCMSRTVSQLSNDHGTFIKARGPRAAGRDGTLQMASADEVFVGSIDQGTTSSRFLIFDRSGEPVAVHQEEFSQIHPKPGWHEHDAEELVTSIEICVEKAVKSFENDGYSRKSIKAIGITNQRETMVVWDVTTGSALHNAIVWTDTRTAALARELKARPGSENLQNVCGLPISTYPSVTKLLWLLKYNENVRKVFDAGNLAFGTIDTWLTYKLNGGLEKNVFVTETTNASRTMFMDIHKMEYNADLLDFFSYEFDLRKVHLPRIVKSADNKAYGQLSSGPLKGWPITGCLGDQSAALVGQKGFEAGSAKNTYGTGCFLLYNVGEKPTISEHGLLATVAYDFGKPVYALEGSIAVAGSGVKASLPLLSLPRRRGRSDEYHKRGHIARATLEAVCFQTKAILDAMEKDSGHKLTQLNVDGGMSNSALCMQTQADLVGISIVRPKMRETTALGAAIAAGFASDVWKDFDELKDINTKDETIFEPKMDAKASARMFRRWERAVIMSKGWLANEEADLSKHAEEMSANDCQKLVKS